MLPRREFVKSPTLKSRDGARGTREKVKKKPEAEAPGFFFELFREPALRHSG